MQSNFIKALLLAAASVGVSYGDSKTKTIETQYLQLKDEEIDIGDMRPNSHGDFAGSGAISFLPDRNQILYATPNGVFYIIDIKNGISRKSSIPSLNIGDCARDGCGSYTYIESLPRVHDIVIHDGFVYASYDRYSEGGIRQTISKTTIKSGQKWVDIWSSPTLDVSYYTLDQGGRLLFDRGSIIASVGSYSLDRKNGMPSDFSAQNNKNPFGKIIRIANNGGFDIIAKGLRNPFGMTSFKGSIYVADHGPRGGDGIFLIRSGNNFGWPYQSMGTKYESYDRISKNQNYSPALFYFTPSIAPSQMIDASTVSSKWSNSLILGSLKALSIYRVNLRGQIVDNVEEIKIGERIRDADAGEGHIALLTDNYKIHLLSDSKSAISNPLPEKCAACHAWGSESASYKRFAPALSGLASRNIASLSGYQYSEAFTAHKGKIWTRDSFTKFLEDIEKFSPGTAMPEPIVHHIEFEYLLNILFPPEITKRPGETIKP